MNAAKQPVWHFAKPNLKILAIIACLFFNLIIATNRPFISVVHAKTSHQSQTQIRAAFIYQMAKFVNWSIPAQSPLTFCFFDSDQEHTVTNVLGSLQKSGKLKVQKRSVIIKVMDKDKLQLLSHYQTCSLIYFDHHFSPKLPEELLTQLSKTKLTIGSELAFLGNGGLSALVERKGKLKLYVNRSVYDVGSVVIRSRLLSLARFYPQ
jgi:hypothetical protein